MKKPDQHQHVSAVCVCDRKIGATLGHYEKMRCECGEIWWALQPKRDGPFVAYQWPNPFLPRAMTPAT